eukprot:TRINITY_DN13688_c0_g3_i1.p1 TRINITY_DN13688_c0_g3~~TRINITY_DN13688_c0_g3_i1.p1  ORF type:complete len:427 (+),score=97.10 TRINITY_DN13688_c0_g3_i1:121-1281(+)
MDVADVPASGVASTTVVDGSSIVSAVMKATSKQVDEVGDGDYVVLWATHSMIQGVLVTSGQITNNRFGNFHHDDLIGLPYGSKVRPRRGDRWMAVLRPSPELITQSTVHRTQIIYHADISLLLMLLDVGPGKVVVEAGTGSGSVSASMARALRPGGHLHTFEFHAERQQQAAEEFRKQGLEDVVTSHHGDICTDGVGEALRDDVDAVFLDLPAPWSAMPHVDACLVEGGRICTFSPCIEQIERTAQELRRRRYQGIRMMETLAVNWGVKAEPPPKRPRIMNGDQRNRGNGGGKGGKGGGNHRDQRKAGAETAGGGGCSDDEAAATGEGRVSAGTHDGLEEDANATKGDIEQVAGSKAVSKFLSFQMPMRGHTGFLLVGTRPPHDEP